MPEEKSYTGGQGRLWLQPQGCGSEYLYAGCYNIGDIAIPEGDITFIRCPSRTKPNEWVIIGQVRGAPGNPTASLEAPLGLVNYLLGIKCDFGIQNRYVVCGRPDDPDAWESIVALTGATITARGITQQGAREPGQNNVVMVTAGVTFERMDFVKRPDFTSITVTATTGAQLADVSFCDVVECAGECGAGSIGCQVGYAVTKGLSAPNPEQIWKTEDGGITWSALTNPFTGMYDDISSIACSGDTVIIGNGVTAGEIARSEDGGDTWTVITLPDAAIVRDIFMLDASRVWAVGDGGYVFFSSDGGLTWETQDAGSATTENLLAIHGTNSQNLIAVGENGTVIRTTDGESWSAATSGTAEDLRAVSWASENLVWIGGANGALYYSRDRGVTWTAKTWPGAATDTINAIRFCGCSFGFFGATTAAVAGRLYSTIDGGYTFRLETIPSVPGVNAIWCCSPNQIFLAANSGAMLRSYAQW